MQGLHAAAKRGNVSAVKAYLSGIPEFVPLAAETPAPSPQPQQPAAPAPIAVPKGKKEAANAAAKTAQFGTGWDGILPGGAPVQ